MTQWLTIDSDFHYPPENIALEAILRMQAGPGPACFLCYINQPSIIIGRNQDYYTEVAQDTSLPVFRRGSGGGAVYHDLGNLNWAYITRGGLADRAALLDGLVAVLQRLGLPVLAGPRSGLYIAGQGGSLLKVGGTASACGQGNLLFHGTLLVDSQLDAIAANLAAHQPGYGIKARLATTAPGADPGAIPRQATPSIAAVVANLSAYRPGLSARWLGDYLLEAYGQGPSRKPGQLLDSQEHHATSQAWADKDWIVHRRGQPALAKITNTQIPTIHTGKDAYEYPRSAAAL